jgi:exopolysaccharide biosynthesis polyprenyl glycosylphosphotransferase
MPEAAPEGAGAEERSPGDVIQRHLTAFRLALMGADAFSAAFVFLAVALLRFGGPGWETAWYRLSVSPWLAAGTYALIWVGALWLHGLYILRARWSLRSEAYGVLHASLILAVATFSILFVLRAPEVSRVFLLLLFAAQTIATLASRLLLRRLLGWLRSHGRIRRYMVVVGTGAAAQAFADRVERHADLGITVIGHLAWTDETERPRRPILGTLDDIERVLHSRVVDEVAIALPSEAAHMIEPITRLCEDEGRIVRIPLDVIGLTVPGGRIEDFDGIPLLSLLYGPDRVLSLVAKRSVDIVVSALALVALAPLLATIGLLIRFRDGRSILFAQERVGLHGRPFRMLKFRTMLRGAEARLAELEALNEVRGPAFKVTNDPRLTRSGRLLRRTSLDELPQLLNVLRGEMSLVGPRPPLPAEVAGYDVWHRRRLSMKPGITGLWQVGARRDPDFDRWVQFDLDYIDRWSLLLDLKIILRTIPALMTQTGR